MTEVPPIESKFRLVHIASRRAEQLMMGARPKLETKHAKVTRIALDEVDANVDPLAARRARRAAAGRRPDGRPASHRERLTATKRSGPPRGPLADALAYYRDLGVEDVWLASPAAAPPESRVAGPAPALPAAERAPRPRGGGGGLPEVRPLRDPDADGLLRRLADGAAPVRRRGAGRRRGRAGRPVRRPRRAAPDEDDRGRDGTPAERRLHLQRPEVPAPRQPEPRARRDRGLPRLPRGPDRRDPARRPSSRSGSSRRSSSSRPRRGSCGCGAGGGATGAFR